MTETLTLRIPLNTKIILEGLATMTRQSLGGVVERAVEVLLESLNRDQRSILRELSERTLENVSNPGLTAAEIWEQVNARFIQPARKLSEVTFEIVVRDFHHKLGLRDKHMQIIQALRSGTRHRQYGIRLISESSGQPKVFKFRLA